MVNNIPPRRFFLSFLCSFVAACGGLTAAPPAIAGLQGKHPLNEVETGRLLIGELRCAACHSGIDPAGMKSAPDLSEVGSRLTGDFLKRFLANPAKVHSGTTMPDLLGTRSQSEREEIGTSLAHYLGSLKSKPRVEETDHPAASASNGQTLFQETGCLTCHSPLESGNGPSLQKDLPSLAHVPGKYQPGALAQFLHTPLQTRPSGRMPDMKLTRHEAGDLAAYLGGEEGELASHPAPTADEIRQGQQWFQELNCIACHQQDSPVPPPGPALADLDFTKGCLQTEPGTAPHFSFDESQIKAIQSALETPAKDTPPNDAIKLHLTRLNCIACHIRDDFGGVNPALDSYFHSTEEALGNEARIPPPLTLIGAKLRPGWLRKVLYDGETVRPYMTTRMPQFGNQALEGLPELFAAADQLPPVDLPPPDQESQPKMSNGAHLLLGDQGLNCIACHNYNGKDSPGMKGMDLMTSYQRLQPAWFYNYMLNPGAYRPGIIMPSYWPEGKAVQTEILDGDTHAQLRALWHQFSLGRSARDPSGLVQEDSRLLVTDKPRTYRGRSQVAGYRGIAVGFPGGLNYAFNAQNGALTAIWKGDFIRVGWQGQGAGNFNPLGRTLQLSQDVAFLSSQDEKSPWPSAPVRTKEAPVNPDPLYPRNHGYAFKGYFFDKEAVPTFIYQCGDVTIHDTITTVEKEGVLTLLRTLKFDTPAATSLSFKALSGEIKKQSSSEYSIKGLKVSLFPGQPLLRPLDSEPNESEVIQNFDLPAGLTTHTLSYELLP